MSKRALKLMGVFTGVFLAVIAGSWFAGIDVIKYVDDVWKWNRGPELGFVLFCAVGAAILTTAMVSIDLK